MEINLKQRVIGGVVLIALAIIFVPIFFTNHTPKNRHQQLTLESSIPAQPMHPSQETTVNLQGEELNPQKSITATAPSLNTETSQNAPATQAPTPAPPQPLQSNSNNTSLNTPPPAQNPVVAKEINAKLDAQDSALLEPMENKSTPVVKTVTPVEVKPAKKAAKKVKVVTVKPVEVKHKKLPAAQAWVVQLGSFGNATKAKALEKQLREKGFIVYSHAIKTSIGSMTRVYVGPEIKREKAEALRVKLDHQLHIKGVVVAFQPAKTKNA